MRVSGLVFFVVLFYGTWGCHGDHPGMNRRDLFRAQVTWISITYFGTDDQGALTRHVATITDSSAVRTIVASVTKVTLTPVAQPDAFSFGHTPAAMFRFGTERGVVRAAYTADWFRIIAGPRTGEGPMPRDLYDMLQRFAVHAVVDSVTTNLGPNATVEIK